MKCNICNQEIETEKERYTKVEDWSKGKEIGEMWCHVECFRKAMNRELTELEKKAKGMLEVTSKMMNKITGEQEVYKL